MGLLSKKTLKCERCGKEYEARIALGAHICNECKARENAKSDDARGYINYAAYVGRDKYSEAELDKIIDHRNKILEKYRQTEGITRAELMEASDNYKKLSDVQVADVLVRMTKSDIMPNMGAGVTEHFFVPNAFERTVVAVEDVFAVGLSSDYKLDGGANEVILCSVFTNDPYIPVFPMIFVGKLGFLELTKSKKGRQEVISYFEGKCPNLTYPVQDLKDLKKQIKADNSVKGNIDVKFMLDRISDASVSTGVFDTKYMSSDLPASTAQLLDQYGYIPDAEINSIMKMDKMFNRNFWNKHLERLIQG